MTNITLHVNSNDSDNLYPLELFLSDWLYDICSDEYSIDKLQASWNIKFNSAEDAVMVKLTDIPPDIGKYLDMQ